MMDWLLMALYRQRHTNTHISCHLPCVTSGFCSQMVTARWGSHTLCLQICELHKLLLYQDNLSCVFCYSDWKKILLFSFSLYILLSVKWRFYTTYLPHGSLFSKFYWRIIFTFLEDFIYLKGKVTGEETETFYLLHSPNGLPGPGWIKEPRIPSISQI